MSNELSDKAAELRRAYLRKWRKEHPEQCKQHQKNYWEKKAAKMAAAESNSVNE